MKPTIFNTEMVRAILEGRKTVTRRVVKFKAGQNPRWTGYIPDGPVLYGSNNIPVAKAPYHAGDILYIRETWARTPDLFDEFPQYLYRADYSENDLHMGEGNNETTTDFPACVKWRPSIHMPKEAARIFLRVKSVTAQRLRDMVLGDVLNEGIQEAETYEETWNRWHKLWDSTVPKHPNKFKSYPFYWQDNPWVWVIKFERISREIAFKGGCQ